MTTRIVLRSLVAVAFVATLGCSDGPKVIAPKNPSTVLPTPAGSGGPAKAKDRPASGKAD